MPPNRSPELELWIQNNPEITSTDVPSWETLSAAQNMLIELSKELNSQNPTLEDIKKITTTSLILAEEPESKYFAIKLFSSAIARFERLTDTHPEAANAALCAAAELAIAAQIVITGNAASRYNSHAAKIKPILKVNETAEIRRSKACEFAKAMWDEDSDQEFRLGEMAAFVRDKLQRDGHEDLPKTERIKEWIKSVAPPYARRPGRGKSPQA